MCSVQCTVATSVGCIPADGLSHEGRRRGSCCNWPAALLKRRVRLTQSARVVWGRHAATAVQGMLSPWFGFAAAHVCHLPVKQLPVLPGAMCVFCNCACLCTVQEAGNSSERERLAACRGAISHRHMFDLGYAAKWGCT